LNCGSWQARRKNNAGEKNCAVSFHNSKAAPATPLVNKGRTVNLSGLDRAADSWRGKVIRQIC
jgi:hypothetical protein